MINHNDLLENSVTRTKKFYVLVFSNGDSNLITENNSMNFFRTCSNYEGNADYQIKRLNIEANID